MARKTSRKKAVPKATGRDGLPAEKRVLRTTREIGFRILAGSFRPGKTIPAEIEFCAELGVSRTVLREAIKLLTSKGLLTPRVKVGTIVNPREHWNYLDPFILEWLPKVGDVGPLLVKLFDMRKALEPEAAALAARNAMPEDLERLRLAFADMIAATDDFGDWIAADLRFHQAIYLGTRNEFFWPIGRLLEPALLASFRVTSRAPHHHQQCLPEHRAVHDAILARDPARAHRAAVELMSTTDANLAQAMGLNAPRETGRSRRRTDSEKTSRSGLKVPAAS